jgi:hypothetical protein
MLTIHSEVLFKKIDDVECLLHALLNYLIYGVFFLKIANFIGILPVGHVIPPLRHTPTPSEKIQLIRENETKLSYYTVGVDADYHLFTSILVHCIHVRVQSMQNLHIINISFSEHFLEDPDAVHYREVFTVY